jgi:hypothetical protein
MKSHQIKQVLLLIVLLVLLLTGCKLPGESKTQATATPDALALSASPTPTTLAFESATPLAMIFSTLIFTPTSTPEVIPTITLTEIISMPTESQANNTVIVPPDIVIPQDTAIVAQETAVPLDTVIVPAETAASSDVVIIPLDVVVIVPQDTAIVPPEGDIITPKTPTPCYYCTDD